MNKLLRVDGPDSYRLMAFEQHDGRWTGKTAGGNSLREDIADFRQPGRRPLYAVFVRPATIGQQDGGK